MSRKRRDRARSQPTKSVPERQREEVERFTFTLWTGVYGGAGLVSIVLGFVMLSQEFLVIAPILLVLGFVVFIPLALVK
jgi:hypothetical protein